MNDEANSNTNGVPIRVDSKIDEELQTQLMTVKYK